MALVMALFTMTTLMLVTTAGLLVGAADIRATRNYRGAVQVHFAAESGISEALQLVNGVGVVNLQNDVANQWTNIWGGAPHTFAPLGGFSLTVTTVALDANTGRLTSTATGPEGVRNTVVATVVRSNAPSGSPGAVYLATDSPTNATFDGNAFAVDGNDHNYTGGAGPGAPVPGISTRNDTNTQRTISSLSAGQKDNVTGLGYQSGPPMVPSVETSPAAPTVSQLDQIVTDLTNRPGVVHVDDKSFSGTKIFGTELVPQITYFTATGDVTIKGNGSVSGAGILIVDGNLTIQGNIEFKGLIIVRGGTSVKKDPTTKATGNATLYGSLWTTDINLALGGSAIVYYSSQALQLANNVGGGGALPAPLTVTSLADCAQLPAAVGGCP